MVAQSEILQHNRCEGGAQCRFHSPEQGVRAQEKRGGCLCGRSTWNIGVLVGEGVCVCVCVCEQ